MLAEANVPDLDHRLLGVLEIASGLWAQVAPRPAPAAGGPPKPSYVLAIILALTIFVGVPLVYYLRRDVTGTDEDGDDLLAEFERAYFAGEMDEAEFRRVRESLERRGLVAPAAPSTRTRPAARPTGASAVDPTDERPKSDAPAAEPSTPEAEAPAPPEAGGGAGA